MKKLLLFITLLASSLQAETLHLVKDGKLTEFAQKEGGSWREVDGVLRGEGTGQRLVADLELTGSKFEIEAELSVAKIDQTAAGVFLGSGFFGFDGANGKLFTEGGSFQRDFYESGLIQSGKEFTFKAVAADGKITFFVGGKEIITQPYEAGTELELAVRPHRNAMNIRNLKVSGEVAKPIIVTPEELSDISIPQPNPNAASDDGEDTAKPSLLPMPQNIEWGGTAIALETANVKMGIPRRGIDRLRVGQLQTEIRELLKANSITHAADASYPVVFKLGKVDVPNQWEGQAEEGYSLVSAKHGVIIEANSVLGLYRGLQTLRQLIVRKDGQTTVASCKIQDYPAFKIRGFMHDVGRNFQTLEQLKMQIDIMAAYKYSVFHWHMTEYYGWRLESKIYPELQSDKAFGRYHGKYYTQKEFKEMSDYCWARGITIIPEFDTPGHSDAFKKGLGIEKMADPRAKKAIVELIHELCSLAPPERMPYIHVGTDEVRSAADRVDDEYLPALFKAVHANDREVIGWWAGMSVPGDSSQIQQTWAQYSPRKGNRHIDSRSNYVNHLEALDFAVRMFFQQPCGVPHGDEHQLGGILAHWPDTLVEDQQRTLLNNPILPAMVGYSEAVWKGIPKDRKEYWAKLPPKGTPEYTAFADFENRLASQRDRFLTQVPFPMVKTHQIEWRLLGPVADGEVTGLEEGIIKDSYTVDGEAYKWTRPVYGGAIHTRHFFNFSRHINNHPKGKDIVWGNTHVYSPVDQEVDAWIAFNTISSSDDRAGAARQGNWSAHPACNIWINGERIAPPGWHNPGKTGKEIALIDNVYTSREPAKIKLQKGWNTVLVKSARKFKWVFSFSPVVKDGGTYREVEGLKYSAVTPAD